MGFGPRVGPWASPSPARVGFLKAQPNPSRKNSAQRHPYFNVRCVEIICFFLFPFLGAVDRDSPPDRMTFQLSNSKDVADCGEVFLSPRPNRPVRRFTQEDLEAGRVGFRHTGKKGFCFCQRKNSAF